MTFALTSDQEMVRKMVAEFTASAIAPAAEGIDRERRYPKDLLQQMGGLGLMGMLVDPKYGGAGTDTVAFALAVEEVARGCATTASAMTIHNALAAYVLNLAEDEELKGRLLPALASGQQVGTLALAEPGAGSDLNGVRAKAVKQGDEYVLNGLKSFVAGGSHADLYLVFARVPGTEGLTAFAVPADTPGLRFGLPERMLSLRGLHYTQLFLNDARVPAANRVGAEGDGVSLIQRALDVSNIAAAATAVGLLEAALHESIAFANQRVQFRQPIKNFQAIQWKIADMEIAIRESRLLVLEAADLRDRGEDFAVAAAAAKVRATEDAKKHTQDAIRVHGGTGFMRDVPLERFNRDARALSVFGGTTEMQKAFIAHRKLF
ncbi:MAG TPA: acyl-CoA dehydrogenase family protein [Candidatus Thermoplasmatota archaeon]|nr:acyl-CoA dehydrogenase family protein [Candidatus Thermoplasmatota archaeon]